MDNFTGTVKTFDLSGGLVSGIGFQNGVNPCDPPNYPYPPNPGNPPSSGNPPSGGGPPPAGPTDPPNLPIQPGNPGYIQPPSNYTPPATGGGGGSSGGGDGNTTVPCDTKEIVKEEIIGVTPDGENYYEFTNACGGKNYGTKKFLSAAVSKISPCDDDGSGVIVLPGVSPNTYEFDPCDQLKGLKDLNQFTSRMEVLKNNIPSGTVEKGIILFDNSTDPVSPIITGGGYNGNVNNRAWLELRPIDMQYRAYGGGHNHLALNKDHIGVPTPEDLNLLLLFGVIETSIKNPYKKDLPINAIQIVTTEIGLFALKINDISKLNAFLIKYKAMVLNPDPTEFDRFIKKFSDPTKYNIQKSATHNEQVIGFLRFMDDNDIGIDFYEGNINTYGDWKKLDLVKKGDGTFDFNSTPCKL